MTDRWVSEWENTLESTRAGPWTDFHHRLLFFNVAKAGTSYICTGLGKFPYTGLYAILWSVGCLLAKYGFIINSGLWMKEHGTESNSNSFQATCPVEEVISVKLRKKHRRQWPHTWSLESLVIAHGGACPQYRPPASSFLPPAGWYYQNLVQKLALWLGT